MPRHITALLLTIALATLAAPAEAQVQIRRHGTENPAVEVFRSTMYGGFAGITVGLAIVSLDKGADGREVFRKSFGIGTLLGLAMGLQFVTTRPQPTGMLELQDGAAHLAFAPPEVTLEGGVRMRLIGARF